MNRPQLAVLIAALAIAMAMLGFGDSSARERRGGQRQEKQAESDLNAHRGEGDVSSLSPEALEKAFVGTWNDEHGRFWFTIDDVAGNQVRSAQFYLAHLKDGHIEGSRLTLNSMSCVPLVGCYDYKIDGKLITPKRMDMHATDEAGETVHFVLVRK